VCGDHRLPQSTTNADSAILDRSKRQIGASRRQLTDQQTIFMSTKISIRPMQSEDGLHRPNKIKDIEFFRML
jgi:hypothetical protein